MAISGKLFIGFFVSVLIVIGASFITASTAQAATDTATLNRLQNQLELLRGNVMQLRSSTTTRATSTRPRADLNCMQTALNAREESFKSAFMAFNTSVLSAIDTRKNSLSTLWSTGSTTNRQRHQEITKTWRDSLEVARKKFREDRDAAWKTFRETAQKNCRVTLPREETVNTDINAPAL